MFPRRMQVGRAVASVLALVTFLIPLTTQTADLPKQIDVPIGGPGAATNLVSKPDCDRQKPGRAIAYLQWTPASRKGSEQRVVVTIVRDGFKRGMFDFSEPLSSTATNLVWDRLQGQAIHFWRVLTLQPDGWKSSEIARFRGPTCVNDTQEP